MKILALDQATKITGWSIFEDNQPTAYGTLEVDEKGDAISRMEAMCHEIDGVLDLYAPQFVVLEGVQYQKNQMVYSQLSQMQGCIFKSLFHRQLPFRIIEPSAWKSHVGIIGRKRCEQKEHAIQLVELLYGIQVAEDVAEAVLIGRWATESIMQKESR